ncbi:MAG: L-rhamnose isomerase [Saccharofermentanales bacterium]
MDEQVLMAYESAVNQYRRMGVDVEKAMESAGRIPLSIPCWQGDDGTGFENLQTQMTGGILATGYNPGKARTSAELREDLAAALSMVPGKMKVNLHAIYLDNGSEPVDRNRIEPKHFRTWVEWAKRQSIGLDFNSTFYSHPKSSSGYTLSSPDEGIQDFWIEHGQRCRKIGEYFGKETGEQCVTNLWIPDGEKECPIDKTAPRKRLTESLDLVFSETIDERYAIDAVESKLFGLGSESFVTGSHEFYMGYCMSRKNTLLTLDTGHFHPTEKISDKLAALMIFLEKGLLIHVSRPVRWDSDHVVLFDDELKAIMHELVRMSRWDRTYIALDYFDASINRVMAWVIGARNTRKALLEAFLEPAGLLASIERSRDNSARLALTEELRTMPFGAVWDYYCAKSGVPVGAAWISEAQQYEKQALQLRACIGPSAAGGKSCTGIQVQLG